MSHQHQEIRSIGLALVSSFAQEMRYPSRPCLSTMAFEKRFPRHHNRERSTTTIAETQIAVHCHHYNSRFLATIEGAVGIDGSGLIEKSARQAFRPMLIQCRRPQDGVAELLQLASELYRHLGFGTLDLSQLENGLATQSVSHVVEGYRAGLQAMPKKSCSFTCGFIEAVCAEFLGDDVAVRETACMLEGARRCSFEIAGERTIAGEETSPNRRVHKVSEESAVEITSNADSVAIVDALLALNVSGDNSGLVQAFDVYLANMPVDFYNLAAISYLEQMRSSGRGEIANHLLANDAEMCALNTFRGLSESVEWKNITKDTLTTSTDRLVAFSAVCRALGWGEYRVKEHVPGKKVTFTLSGGYEAVGYMEHRGTSEYPSCSMFLGGTAGIVELAEGTGPVIERAGQYTAKECNCQACGDDHCRVQLRVTQ